jgi:transposase
MKGEEVKTRLTVTRLSGLERELGPNTPAAVVAIEACREAWHVHDVLTAWGHQVVLVDTTRVRALGIGVHGKKTDRVDVETLARAVVRGTLPRAHVLSPHRRELRLQLGVRRALVATRAEYITTVRGLCRAHGVRIPTCTAEHFVKHARETKKSEAVIQLCEPMLTMLERVEVQLAIVETKLEELCAKEPIIELLATAPGVSRIVAAAFVACVDEAKRFDRAHQLESYLGLVPCEDSSGDRRRLGHITKHGNAYVRALLVQAAWNILNRGADTDPLYAWAKALEQRRGKRIAVVAIARRLAGILWAMWRDGTFYDARLLGTSSAKGLRVQAQSAEDRADAMARVAEKMKRHMRRPRAVLKGEKTSVTHGA